MHLLGVRRPRILEEREAQRPLISPPLTPQAWLRSDQYREDGTPALGASGWEELSSASEYVAQCADGGLIFVNDEALGVGLRRVFRTPPRLGSGSHV